MNTNILMDVFAADPKWADWSIARLDEWSRRGPLFVNPVIYAELGAGFASVEALDAVIEKAALTSSGCVRSDIRSVARCIHLRQGV